LDALKDQVIKDDKAEDVVPVVYDRIGAFLQPLKRYKKYFVALLMDKPELRKKYRRIEVNSLSVCNSSPAHPLQAQLKTCLETRQPAHVYIVRLIAAREEMVAVAPMVEGNALV
jgi:hypothetical protein